MAVAVAVVAARVAAVAASPANTGSADYDADSSRDTITDSLDLDARAPRSDLQSKLRRPFGESEERPQGTCKETRTWWVGHDYWLWRITHVAVSDASRAEIAAAYLVGSNAAVHVTIKRRDDFLGQQSGW